MRKILIAAAVGLFAGAASAEDLKIALIYGKTGPLEASEFSRVRGVANGYEVSFRRVDFVRVRPGQSLIPA